jgi:hypothetical protein
VFDPGIVRAELIQTPQEGCFDEADAWIVDDRECILQLCDTRSVGLFFCVAMLLTLNACIMSTA